MLSKVFRAFLGAFIGVVIDILIDLIAAGAEKRSFVEQLLSTQGIWILVGIVLTGIIIGVLLETPNKTNVPSTPLSRTPEGVTISRSKFKRSKNKYVGGKILVEDSKFVDSDTEIDNTK